MNFGNNNNVTISGNTHINNITKRKESNSSDSESESEFNTNKAKKKSKKINKSSSSNVLIEEDVDIFGDIDLETLGEELSEELSEELGEVPIITPMMFQKKRPVCVLLPKYDILVASWKEVRKVIHKKIALDEVNHLILSKMNHDYYQTPSQFSLPQLCSYCQQFRAVAACVVCSILNLDKAIMVCPNCLKPSNDSIIDDTIRNRTEQQESQFIFNPKTIEDITISRDSIHVKKAQALLDEHKLMRSGIVKRNQKKQNPVQNES